MPVKIVIKGTSGPIEKPKIKPKPEQAEVNPLTITPIQKQRNIFILTRIKKTFRIMMMDIKMLFNRKLREEYGDYSRFAELARRGMK